MKKCGTILLCGMAAWLAAALNAADIAGPWHAQFESPRGVQKYQFTFQPDGEKLTGKAVSEVGERKREAELKEGAIKGDTVTFGIDVYFVGDSITRRWGATDYPELLANWNINFFGWHAANFGWGADQIENMLWRLKNGELDGVNPQKLHPTVKAYQVWADGLKPIFTEILGPPAKTDHAPPPTGDPSAKPQNRVTPK